MPISPSLGLAEERATADSNTDTLQWLDLHPTRADTDAIPRRPLAT